MLAAVVLGFCVATCAAPRRGSAELPPDGRIAIDATPVPLNPADASATAIGDFAFAGGIVLSSAQTRLLHGLSDLLVTKSGRLTAVGDEGIVLDAQMTFDQERLVGLTDARITLLRGEDGQPLSGKAAADAEGLTQLANGDRLVSFERLDRIWLYPAAGGHPRAVAAPRVSFPLNAGMEALTADPETAADAYIVGGEASGQTWSCRVSAAECVKRTMLPKPEEFGLVALATLPGGRTAELLRAYDAVRGNRIVLRVVSGTSELARMEIAPPMSVDNFEGLAAIPGENGRVRFYLISDDNASSRQRTLLLAFDWRAS